MMTNISSDFSSKWLGEEFIDFLDKLLDLRNKFDESFRNKNHTIVLIKSSSLAYQVSKLSGNLRKSFLLLFNFFTDEN